MSTSSPDVPPPPDPRVVAEAQGQLNRETALVNAALNRVNTYGPYGSSTFSQTGSTYVPGQGEIPTYGQTTTLSPQLQSLLDSQVSMAQQQGQVASNQLNRIGQQQPLTSRGLPNIRDGLDIASLPSLDYSGLPQLPGSSGYETSRGAVEEALMSRLAPSFATQRGNLESRYAEMGIPLGSEQYAKGFDELNRAYNDARFQAVLAGGQEQSRLAELDLAARRQGVQEQIARRGIIGQERLENAGLNQRIRQQLFGERLTRQNLPYQQYAQLSATNIPGVPTPGSSPIPQVGIAPGDFQGASQYAHSAQLQQALAASQADRQRIGEVAGLLGTGALATASGAALGPVGWGALGIGGLLSLLG